MLTVIVTTGWFYVQSIDCRLIITVNYQLVANFCCKEVDIKQFGFIYHLYHQSCCRMHNSYIETCWWL